MICNDVGNFSGLEISLFFFAMFFIFIYFFIEIKVGSLLVHPL